MSKLAEFLSGEPRQIRAASELRKAEKLDWQRAVHVLIKEILSWIHEVDSEGILGYSRTVNQFDDDYDVGKYEIVGLSIMLGNTTVRVVPSNLDVVGVIQVPGESQRRKINGRVEFDNGIERVPLYRVKDGDRDLWLWWTHGGIGKSFDRESFEATLVSLLR